jgi:diphosphomevalonate decarboxylase
MQATAIAHPNVALIKYWGKASVGPNQPAVGSLSLTLGELETRTTVSFSAKLPTDSVTINGAKDAAAAERVTRCLDVLRAKAGVTLAAQVESQNNFPTAAGLASSASGYAALIKAADAALGLKLSAQELANIARLGSGSAARSLYSGIVLLNPDQAQQTIHCASLCAPQDWPLVTIVAVTSRDRKVVGSTAGMESSRLTSPLYQGWLDTHQTDLDTATDFVRARDFEGLAAVSEQSCLKMHAVAMSSDPPLVYWSGVTCDVMNRVRELRAAGLPVFFTVDAGPQVKAVCLPEAAHEVRRALAAVDGVLECLVAPLGAAARVVT